ncbi:hypothetical protein DDZ13_09750 [Coraliomargarita sinensis]|uniref:Uncharacterized protein n=1 Tax=Coraliomargarita sinensis TaxID=2174842 RepID=A0A317ZEL8_9BACT|nr:hypothetical protein DDZ13_09750 [Coraliomargarita sinensis]
MRTPVLLLGFDGARYERRWDAPKRGANGPNLVSQSPTEGQTFQVDGFRQARVRLSIDVSLGNNFFH